MKKDGKGFSVTVWSAVALGAVGIGVIVAFLAGYFLGHFTGHETTTTVGVVTGAAETDEAGETDEAAEADEAAETDGDETKGGEAEGGAETESEPNAGNEKARGGEAATGGAGNAEAGAEVFANNCSICHGATGHGGNGGPDLRTAPKAKSEAGAIEQVTNGGGGMPSFEDQLSEGEIKDVAAYVVQDIVGGG